MSSKVHKTPPVYIGVFVIFLFTRTDRETVILKLKFKTAESVDKHFYDYSITKRGKIVFRDFV